MVSNSVSDGNAAHGSSASLMEVTKAIEEIFPKAPNFATVKQNAQTKRYIGASFDFEINFFVSQNVFKSPKGGRC
jgi:hypothetical protein